MLVFVYDDKSVPSRPNVRRIEYKVFDDIVRSLGCQGKVPSTLRAQASPFVPSLAPSSTPQSIAAEHECDEEMDEEVDTKQEDVDAIIQDMPASASIVISEEEMKALN